jgi:hypothetical protein
MTPSDGKSSYCLWQGLLKRILKCEYLLVMSILYRGPGIDASNQVSVHLAKRFQRRRLLKIGQSGTRIACGGHIC